MTAADEHTTADKDTRRSFTLTLADVGSGKLDAVLQLGGRCFTAQGPANQIFTLLFSQLGDAVNFLPRGITFVPLAAEMQRNTRLVDFIAGRPQPQLAQRKSYCEAVCDCCASGGFPFGPFCCISCASCDWFEVNLTGEVNLFGGPLGFQVRKENSQR
jgi:hypothetical protein